MLPHQKNNHLKVIEFVKKAIEYCRDDAVLAPAKKKLTDALEIANHVHKKRSNVSNQIEDRVKKAKEASDKWNKALKDGLSKNLNSLDQSGETDEKV